MSAFIGEIKLFAGNFAPKNWMFCNGQMLAIHEHTALFSLLGTTYGGDGSTTFGLPDLRGRVPIHFGQGQEHYYSLGNKGGAESMRLETSHIPPHSHALANVSINGKIRMRLGAAPGQEAFGTNNFIAVHGGNDDTIFTETTPSVAALNENAIDSSELNINGQTNSIGQGNYFDNRSPYLALNYIICNVGIMPPRS